MTVFASIFLENLDLFLFKHKTSYVGQILTFLAMFFFNISISIVEKDSINRVIRIAGVLIFSGKKPIAISK